MASDKHLAKLKKQHLEAKTPGCIWRHTSDYLDSNYKACSHRKNAHQYALDHERDIFDIPNARVSQQRINAMQSQLPGYGGWKGRRRKLVPLTGTSWHLASGVNFKVSSTVPYWHNAHHLIACGEIRGAFNGPGEIDLILAAQWNINNEKNSVLLPKQPKVATLLKLPTHVPPDGKQSHDQYSERVSRGLETIKNSLSNQGEDGDGHPLTDETKGTCVAAFDNASVRLRRFLFDAGKEKPGINLDQVDLSKFNWLEPKGTV